MTYRILVTCAQMQAELSVHEPRLRQAGYEVAAPSVGGQYFTAEELAPMMPGVVGMIAGDDELNRIFFKTSPDLKVLVRWGIGMDSVDHAAAGEHGVVVRNTPGVFGGEVADSALAYMLLLARRHHSVDKAVRAGSWPKFEGLSLAGSTVGLVGLGDIGRGVAARALGFGMRVLAFDPLISPDSVPDAVQVLAALHDVLAQSRFVVLTCPLTPATYRLIDEAALAAMRGDAFLVNVARGPVVHEDALVTALSAGLIAGAGLDVFEVEPLPTDSRLLTMDNVVLGAHNGSNTREGVARASARAVDILLDELGKS
jgi:D-3-phosphoglycerate dehydrogenase